MPAHSFLPYEPLPSQVTLRRAAEPLPFLDSGPIRLEHEPEPSVEDQPKSPGERNPGRPGYGLPRPSRSRTSGRAAPTSARLVFRPGLSQYAYLLLGPAIPICIGIATIVYGLTTQSQDWGSRAPWALFEIAFGVVPGAYVLGMRIELDDERVSKVYLFGLVRSTILRTQLRASSHKESSEWGSYTRVEFESADGKGWGFSVHPFWVWRSSDVDKLQAIAVEAESA
jgi:hypothetical protein